MTSAELKNLLLSWKEGKCSLWIVFLWGADTEDFPGAIGDVGDASVTILREGSNPIVLPLTDAVAKLTVPSQAPREVRGVSVAKFERCLELVLTGGARCAFFEMKSQ